MRHVASSQAACAAMPVCPEMAWLWVRANEAVEELEHDLNIW